MNNIIIFILILFLGIIPLAIILLWIYFKGKLLFKLGALMIFLSAILIVCAYIVGSHGLVHLVWTAPLSIIILFAFLILLGRIIQQPIRRLVSRIKSISEGSLNVDFDEKLLNRNDEIGEIASAIIDLSNVQREILNGIINEADKIALICMKLNSESQGMSQETSEQAASVEEISASMEEILANIDQNSLNSNETLEIANKSATNIAIVNKAVLGAVNSVKSIINKVTIINQFAMKTNILAINAAIEAARAGQHGKGFAVVASEVRTLAENSQIAASDIDTLTNNSIKTFDRSVNLLQLVIPEIQKTSGLVKEISNASMEQHAGAEQVNNAIQQLNQVTQKNAVSAEKLLAHSETFLSFINNLKEKIAFFKLNGDV